MTVTYETKPRLTAPCSTPWCELPADHDFGEGLADGARMHSTTPAATT